MNGSLDKLKSAHNGFKENVNLSSYTTLGIGGSAKLFIEVHKKDNLKKIISLATEKDIKFMVIGSGSNLLVADHGFDGIVIKNSVAEIDIAGNRLNVMSGTLLQELIDTANKNSLSGLETLAGIPGTIAGAIFGNAGAYGQNISNRLVGVEAFDGKKNVYLSKQQCEFNYRDSIFKKNKNLLIISAEFELEKGDRTLLESKSKNTIETRKVKYPPSLKCPGSFFKNVIASVVPQDILSVLPQDKIVHGKIPAGYLLEEVGAKGAKQGDIIIADYHANLFINKGTGTAQDLWNLAREYKNKVEDKFGITLEPEVQLIGFNQPF